MDGPGYDSRQGQGTFLFSQTPKSNLGPTWLHIQVHPSAAHGDPEGEWRYICTLSLDLTLEGGGGSTPRLGLFTPERETRYEFDMMLCGIHGWSERVRKISPPPGFHPRTVHPVASRYTYCAILPRIQWVPGFFSRGMLVGAWFWPLTSIKCRG